MSEPNTIKINEVEYVRKDIKPDGDIKIVVADRGFVYVGHLTLDENFATLRGASNIRVWGTTKGLGELVPGPTKKTICDLVGTVRIPLRAVISIIDVELSKWNSI